MLASLAQRESKERTPKTDSSEATAKMKDAGKSLKASGKSSSEMRKDRKSATGMNGSPKKGGHGGKFTWIGRGYSQVEIGIENGAVDAKDPNFEDPEEVGSA